MVRLTSFIDYKKPDKDYNALNSELHLKKTEKANKIKGAGLYPSNHFNNLGKTSSQMKITASFEITQLFKVLISFEANGLPETSRTIHEEAREAYIRG